MNEADTRAQLIEPLLRESGWEDKAANVKISREFIIAPGRVGGSNKRGKTADFVLEYRHRTMAVIEAKSDKTQVGEGVAQAKKYAALLHAPRAFATNGRDIYRIDMQSGAEGPVAKFPTPQELWRELGIAPHRWRDAFHDQQYAPPGASGKLRAYQMVTIDRALDAIADGQRRILLTLATGTGKTRIALEIVWKLFQTRWNLGRDGKRRPRVLFLTDRNILARQALLAFSAFPDDALVRITPKAMRARGREVPMNGNIFFTIFQTFMTGAEEMDDEAGDGEAASEAEDGGAAGEIEDDKALTADVRAETDAPDPKPCFYQYPHDYFDVIIIDECHRGGAHDESEWRKILGHFSAGVQIGLTATPRRDINADTYAYFGEPLYIYSLRQGIEDGYLTPFKVRRHQSTIDTYQYDKQDDVIEGTIDPSKEYNKEDFNSSIEIKQREQKLLEVLLREIETDEKTIIFCRNQRHAQLACDFINQSRRGNPFYCCRVTSNDGDIGEQHLRNFQDNEQTTPTILTTSSKLSTGVDALNIRHIALMRPIGSMIEFKQIIGRGTRLFEGKRFFTIHDFVGATNKFSDPEWDGEPSEPPLDNDRISIGESQSRDSREPFGRQLIEVRLADETVRTIRHTSQSMFFDRDGHPISAEQFLQRMYGDLPRMFADEAELRRIWSKPDTRATFLDRLANAGYNMEALTELQRMVTAERSDLFDVLEYVAYAIAPISRAQRVRNAKPRFISSLDKRQRDFLDFVLQRYIASGIKELAGGNVAQLLEIKYHTLADAENTLGTIESVRKIFISFQKHLYA